MADHDTDDEPSIKLLFTRLSEDARRFAHAELAYIRAELEARSALALPALAMIAIAVVLIFGALVALLVGLTLALAPLLTPLGATLLIFGLAILLAFILLWVARARLKAAFKPMDDL